MQTSIPQPIQPLLDAYLAALESCLPGYVTGLYLHGSIALGAFDERHSDIDFVALVSRPTTATDIEQLAAIHRQIIAGYPRWQLEGSYLPWAEVGRLESEIAAAPTHHDGKLDPQGRFDMNSITWWVLKHRGIALLGPSPETLPFDVDWEVLITTMRANLNTYWLSFTQRPQRMVWLLTDFGIEWTVLGVLRQYYTFVAHDITSKVGAGDYALAHLPARWHPLIREALRIRRLEPSPLYRTKVARAAEAYNFLRYIIDYCNALPA